PTVRPWSSYGSMGCCTHITILCRRGWLLPPQRLRPVDDERDRGARAARIPQVEEKLTPDLGDGIRRAHAERRRWYGDIEQGMRHAGLERGAARIDVDSHHFPRSRKKEFLAVA